MNKEEQFKKSPLKFYLLLFIISIPFWIIGSILDKGLPLPMNLPVSALMFICPLIAALILVYKEDKPFGILLLFKKVFNYKRIKQKIWYVPSFFLMPIIMLMSYGIMRLMRTPISKIHFPFLMIPIFFVMFFISAVAEEAGWMGYAFEQTQDKGSALKNSIIMEI